MMEFLEQVGNGTRKTNVQKVRVFMITICIRIVFHFWAALFRKFHAWLHSFILIKLDVAEVCAIWVHPVTYEIRVMFVPV